MSHPLISVVIGARNGSEEVVHCLRALYASAEIRVAEIILADSSDDDTEDKVRRQFPDVRLLHFSSSLTIHELRSRGIAETRGAIIAVIDPFSIVDVRWLSQIIKAHQERPNLVIGGIVELYDAPHQSLIHWTVYLYDYARHMAPRDAGETDILAASNISYKREALFDQTGPKFKVFWKEFFNRELKASGQSLWMDPSIVVYCRKPISFQDFFRSRYDNGRCFSGMRAASFGTWKRLFYAGATPILPLLFLWRSVSQFWGKRRFRAKFVLTLPLQGALFISWSVGEFVGYLRGPGKSCEILYY